MEHLVKTALDAGFVNKCAEYGIEDAETVGQLMKLAADQAIAERQEMQKQAGLGTAQNTHQVEMQKQANLQSADSALDAGFINRCHEYGVTDPGEIHSMMKVAFHLVQEQEQLNKQASLNQDEANLYNILSRL